MQEGFSFNQAPSELKVKRAKGEIIEVHGGRIVRSAGGKDRHSKVCTARGTRDRRVRLSPNTAIQFYDVQDRLGYDRPSKAIDWLIREAKAAIDALEEPPLMTSSNVQDKSSRGTGSTNQQDVLQESHEDHICSFSFFSMENGAAPPPPSTEFQTHTNSEFDPNLYPTTYQQSGLISSLNPSRLDTNYMEMSRLQRILNTANSVPDLGQDQIFSQREPLQSSIINFPPVYSPFGQEFQELMEDKIPFTSKQPSSREMLRGLH